MALGFDLPKLDLDTERQILNRYNEWARSNNKIEAENYGELVHETWSNIFDRIRKKLTIEDEQPIKIQVKVTIEGEDPNEKSLEFKSPNRNRFKNNLRPTSWNYYP